MNRHTHTVVRKLTDWTKQSRSKSNAHPRDCVHHKQSAVGQSTLFGQTLRWRKNSFLADSDNQRNIWPKSRSTHRRRFGCAVTSKPRRRLLLHPKVTSTHLSTHFSAWGAGEGSRCRVVKLAGNLDGRNEFNWKAETHKIQRMNGGEMNWPSNWIHRSMNCARHAQSEESQANLVAVDTRTED